MANRNFMKNVLMGNGIAQRDGADLGYLSGKSEFNFSYDIEKFKEGAPLVLIGQETKECMCELKCGLAEFSPENASVNLGGLAVVTTGTTESIVVGDNQTRQFRGNYAASGYQFIELDGPNVTSPVLKNASNSVTYVAGTDYLLMGISPVVVRLPGGTIPADATVNVTSYGYTQVAGKQINLGSSFNLEFGSMTFIHPRSKYNKKKITIHLWKSQASGNVTQAFEDGKFAVTDLIIAGIFDETHPDNPFGYIHWEE